MVLRSKEFDDVYFSAEDGLAETHHVFLKGNDLPAAWQGVEGKSDRFVIGETGFGTGLNFLAAWKLFEETADEGQSLEFISFEKYPLSVEEIADALEPWRGEFDGRLERMLALYPLRVPGSHRVQMSARVGLTLIIDDVNEGMAQLDTREDAWFLDGFNPAKNPQMWSEEVFLQMARLSASGASFATFTAAGFVKRGLAAAGFDVEKTDGFGRKRHMLVGVKS